MRTEGYIGWAIRKNGPMLTEALLDAYKQVVKKQNLTIVRQVQYQKRIKQISHNTGRAERKRFEQTLALFEKYGQKYNFDPLMLAAQGY